MKTSKLYNSSSARNRGFSIIELLIALIIIGILVSILIPVISNRAEDAKATRAVSDLENIANAEERMGVDVNYIGRLIILNNIPGSDQFGGLLYNFSGSSTFGNPQYVFIDSAPGTLVNGTEGDVIVTKIKQSETVFGWRGPYLNWQRDKNGTGNTADGIPDDPWGNNYLLFTKQGLVEEPNGVINSTYKDLFDRPTILTLGPNGIPGDNANPQYGKGDDLFRKFGP